MKEPGWTSSSYAITDRRLPPLRGQLHGHARPPHPRGSRAASMRVACGPSPASGSTPPSSLEDGSTTWWPRASCTPAAPTSSEWARPATLPRWAPGCACTATRSMPSERPGPGTTTCSPPGRAGQEPGLPGADRRRRPAHRQRRRGQGHRGVSHERLGQQPGQGVGEVPGGRRTGRSVARHLPALRPRERRGPPGHPGAPAPTSS